jgi:hypothetical protein
MRRRLSLAALLLLGACSLFNSPGPQLPPQDDSPDAQACRAEARNSPEVQALGRQFYAASQTNIDRMQGEVGRAQGRAYRDCMRARGHGPQGGVEPQVPR